MKEITQRLYTKPVLLSMAFLVGMALLVGLFITTKSRAAMTTYIPAGDDEFETTGNGETYHNFNASPVPAGFFGTGSQKYSGLVPLVGVPLDPAVSDVDTVIHRNTDVFTPGSTTITMTALNLNSINSITVSYNDGHTEAWDVRVNLSGLQTSGGSMSFSDGGTFDSSLSVYPKFTFTRVSDGAVKVLDTGDSGGGGLATTQAAAIGGGGNDGGSLQPIAICRAVAVNDFQTLAQAKSNRVTTSAAATASCPPVTLTSTNNPWPITRPLTEQELLASHNASPKGTKKAQAAIGE
jgi:hypothetical protein